MSRTPIATNVWTLTMFRAGGYAKENEIEKAVFAYGRSTDEIEAHECDKLPSGIIEILRSSKMEGEAMETGFVLELSRTRKLGGEWFQFERIFDSKKRVSKSGFGYWATRSTYANHNGATSFEMVPVWCGSDTLPNSIWVKVLPLDSRRLAWAIDKENLFSEESSEQSSLHDFFELNCESPKNANGKPLPLPGPPFESYEFFAD